MRGRAQPMRLSALRETMDAQHESGSPASVASTGHTGSLTNQRGSSDG